MEYGDIAQNNYISTNTVQILWNMEILLKMPDKYSTVVCSQMWLKNKWTIRVKHKNLVRTA